MLVRKPAADFQEEKSDRAIETTMDLTLDDKTIEKDEELDAATSLLIQSIKDNDYIAAFGAIQNKAKINVLVQTSKRCLLVKIYSIAEGLYRLLLIMY